MVSPWTYVTIEIVRTFISWSDPHGVILKESICRGSWQVPDGPTAHTLLSCVSQVGPRAVDVEVKGRTFVDDQSVLHSEFHLRVDPVGPAEPPYDWQLPAVWDFRSRNVETTSWIFLLRPSEVLQIECRASNCHSVGPEAIFRAEVEVSRSNLFRVK